MNEFHLLSLVELSVVVHTCGPSTWVATAAGSGSEANSDRIEALSQKQTESLVDMEENKQEVLEVLFVYKLILNTNGVIA